MTVRPAPKFFATPAAFRAWLAKHCSTSPELVVGFYKVDSGRPSISWPESVDEALCVGWIDGVRKRIDEHSYQIRFSPRRPGSIWSAVNIRRVQALIAEGRMRPPGLAAFEKRIERKSSVYAYEQKHAIEFNADQMKAFKRQRGAWDYFQSTPAYYRRVSTYWVIGAKQPATRERRLAKLIEACARGERLMR